jgi:hypothetical protein
MKIIDLLNKIANGEEPKIKYDNVILKYNKNEKRFTDKDKFNVLYEIDFSELNDEVEIIEEDKNIEKIGNDYYHKTQPEQNQIFQRKINELIDKVNSLENKQ